MRSFGVGLGALVLCIGVGVAGFTAWITGEDSSLGGGDKGVVWALVVGGLLSTWAGLVVATRGRADRCVPLYALAGACWVGAYAAALALA